MRTVIAALVIGYWVPSVIYAADELTSNVDVKATNSSILETSKTVESVESSKQFLKVFLGQPYHKDLVMRFVQAFPHIPKLANLIDRTSSTVYKLKNPDKYGDLKPTAKCLWDKLREEEKGVDWIVDCLGKDLPKFIETLQKLDLSDQNIVHDTLSKNVVIDLGDGEEHPMSVSELVRELRQQKDTFKIIDLSENILGDEGIGILVNELQHHKGLEEIILQTVHAKDKSLNKLVKLMELPNLKKIDILGNTLIHISYIKDIMKELPKDQQKKFESTLIWK